MAGVEYQVTKVDPTDPETKGAVYQVNKVTEEVAATLGGKVYRAKVIKNPSEPTVKGKVYQIVIVDPDTSTQGKVYNAIITGDSEAAVVGPGLSPLVLPDAIANSLSYVKAFGGCEQSDTPTPSDPVDIVCNNGVLKVSPNLFNPTQVQFGYYLNKDTGEKAYNANNWCSSDDGFIPCKPNTDYTFRGKLKDSASVSRLNSIYFFDNNKEYLGYIANTTDYQPATGTTPNNCAYLKVRSNPRSVPMTQEVFDEYNWQLEEGSVATNYIPYGQVYADGTVETIQCYGKNMLNQATRVDNYYINNTGEIVAAAGTCYSAAIPVVAGQKYTLSMTIGATAARRILCYNGDTFVSSLFNTYYTEGEEVERTITIPSGADNIRLTYRQVDTDVQIEKGETATTYEPYYNGGTATAEMLLKVGDFQDVQSIIDGAVTRNLGVVVLDGTETVSKTTSATAPLGYYFGVLTNTPHTADSDGYCSHFTNTRNSSASLSDNTFAFGSSSRMWFATSKFTEASDFKQFLADQYTAGTPVIVVYPLATATSETVTGQPMSTAQGDNTAEITQASLSGLELEAKYDKEGA